jgi:hypothetical protein
MENIHDVGGIPLHHFHLAPGISPKGRIRLGVEDDDLLPHSDQMFDQMIADETASPPPP